MILIENAQGVHQLAAKEIGAAAFVSERDEGVDDFIRSAVAAEMAFDAP